MGCSSGKGLAAEKMPEKRMASRGPQITKPRRSCGFGSQSGRQWRVCAPSRARFPTGMSVPIWGALQRPGRDQPRRGGGGKNRFAPQSPSRRGNARQ